MKYCPECGFELKPGDEFCINCGASLIDYKEASNEVSTETAKKPKKNFFKTPGGIILIVIAAIIIAAGIAFLVYFNSPKNKLLRAVKNTVDDVSGMKTVKILHNVSNGGSIKADANLKDIIDGFSIPLIGQIDATASVKYYMDAENDSYELSLAGGLGGSEALGADVWSDPHRVIIKSPALIGKTVYGFDMSDKSSRKELEGLFKEYLGTDAEFYDKYAEIIDVYSNDKKELTAKIGLELYNQAFKNGEVEKGKEEITIADESQKTEVIRLSFSGEQIRTVLNNTFDKLKDEEDFIELKKHIDEDKIRAGIKEIPDDYKLNLRFYINKKTRLVKVETEADKTNTVAVIGPDPASAKEFLVSISDDGDEFSLKYRIDQDDEKKYLSHISCQLPGKLSDDIGLIKYNLSLNELTGDIRWDKDSEKWELDTNFGFSSDGDFSYDGNKADGVIKNIAFESWKISPNVTVKIKEDDKMPAAPDFMTIRSQEDKDALIGDITDSITQLTEQMLGNAANIVLGQIFGIDIPDEPETVEPEQQTEDKIEDGQEEKPEGKSEENADETLRIGGFEISSKDLAVVQSILGMFGVQVDLDKMDIKAIQSLIDSLGLDEIDPAVLQGTLSMIGIDPSILQPILPQLKENEKKELKTDSVKDDTIDKEKSVQAEGTFSDEMCELKLRSDGTYLLKVSYEQMNYEDSGTFTSNGDNTMQFSSNSGINATGKLFDDHIEVEIPGFGSFSIPKK